MEAGGQARCDARDGNATAAPTADDVAMIAPSSKGEETFDAMPTRGCAT